MTWSFPSAGSQHLPDGFERVPLGEYGQIGSVIPEGFGYWSHAQGGWAFAKSNGAPERWRLAGIYIRPAREKPAVAGLAVCGCGRHYVQPGREYEQHREWEEEKFGGAA